jgi:hypothetical protein
LTGKELSRGDPPIVVRIIAVYAFFIEIRRSCPGPFGFRAVK